MPKDNPAESKTALPSFEDMHTRLVQEMMRCAHEKDAAETELKAHHDQMSGEEKRLTSEIEAHRPHVERLISDEGKLDKATATEALSYMDKLARLARVRQARRMAFTQGGAVGDVAPDVDAEDADAQ